MGAVVNRTFGEEFEYRPYAADDPNGRTAPDAARAVKTIMAVFGDPSARAGMGPARRGYVEPDRAAHASSRPYIELDPSQLPYAIVSGDRVARAKTGEIFRVSEPRVSGNGRVILDLNAV